MRLDDEIERLTASQRACIAVWQLHDLGASGTEISRLRASRRWDCVGPRVLKLAGSPTTPDSTAMAAVLDAGHAALLGFESSAAWWGLGASYRLLRAQVMVPFGVKVHTDSIGHVHPIVGVDPRWCTVLDGIPVVRPELCVYQMCGTVNPWRAERALDSAWAMGLVSGRSLRACLLDLADHGRNGTVVLRTLLEVRPDDYIPPATGIEARFNQIMRDHGLGAWRRQVDSGGEAWAGRVDFRHVDLALIAEVQSERHHAALSSQRDDAERRARLESAGFVVVEAWDSQVWHRQAEVVAIVREGVRRAQRQAA